MLRLDDLRNAFNCPERLRSSGSLDAVRNVHIRAYILSKPNKAASIYMSTITRPQARLELALWQAHADMASSSDLYIRLTEMGLPSEIATRLKGLLEIVKPIGHKMISIGKIIVLKLVEFIERHPHLVTGIALGAAVSSLIASIPFLGPILAPIALALGITVGAIAGHRVDKAQGGEMRSGADPLPIAQDVIEIARTFFQLFIDTLKAISAEFSQ